MVIKGKKKGHNSREIVYYLLFTILLPFGTSHLGPKSPLDER